MVAPAARGFGIAGRIEQKAVTMNVTMQIADIEATLVVTGSFPIVDVTNLRESRNRPSFPIKHPAT